MYITIQTLWKQGLSKSEIARMTGHNWRTVSKVIKAYEAGKERPEKKAHPSMLDSYKVEIINYLEKGLSGVRIHEELLEQGLKTSYSSVKNYIKKIKKKNKICIRFHTEAGEEAQVDFGYVGLTPDDNGKRRKTWVFNMRLSYSRLDYFEKVYDQRVETFIKCHKNAFKYFGGVPKFIKIDNLKAAILEANFYEPVYQELYKKFADHFNFNPVPCRVRQPQEKGKTESGIKYVKNNFFLGRKFKSPEDLDMKLKNWLERRCNARIHGTTRKVPRDLFEKEEKEKLQKLPMKDFKLAKVGTRIVYNDCHVYIDYNYYSVPFEYVGQKVEIELTDNIVKIFNKNKRIAMHVKCKEKGKFITEKNHYPKFKMHLSTENQEEYQKKMMNIGNYASQFFLFILDKNPTTWNRITSGIIKLSKSFTKEVVNLSCKRALAFESTSYKVIEKICKDGLYNLPIENEI